MKVKNDFSKVIYCTVLCGTKIKNNQLHTNGVFHRFELSSKMREACLILKNHLNDDIKTLKSKEVVRPCMLLQTTLSPE